MGLTVNKDNTEEASNGIKVAILRALERIGNAAENHAVEYETAVDTGRLRNSITHAVVDGENAVYIGTNVKYAIYIELGVHGRSGLHYLTNAASRHGDEYRTLLENELQSS